jgi:hypothetical protein
MSIRPTLYALCATLAVSALAATAVAAADRGDLRTPLMTTDNDCMFLRSIYDWHALDDYNLIVWAPSRRQPYVVTLSFPLTGLRFEHQLAFDDHNGDGRLCGFGMDAIIAGGSFPQRASIAGVKRLDGSEIGALEGLYETFSSRPKGPASDVERDPADEGSTADQVNSGEAV